MNARLLQSNHTHQPNCVFASAGLVAGPRRGGPRGLQWRGPEGDPSAHLALPERRITREHQRRHGPGERHQSPPGPVPEEHGRANGTTLFTLLTHSAWGDTGAVCVDLVGCFQMYMCLCVTAGYHAEDERLKPLHRREDNARRDDPQTRYNSLSQLTSVPSLW